MTARWKSATNVDGCSRVHGLEEGEGCTIATFSEIVSDYVRPSCRSDWVNRWREVAPIDANQSSDVRTPTEVAEKAESTEFRRSTRVRKPLVNRICNS